jgi:dipeptidyl aminopeptidase/acylaminoacyl peptidase
MSLTLPYGTWPSRLSAAELASGAIGLGGLIADGDRLVWTEARPLEGGRQAPVAWTRAQGAQDLGPAGFNARTMVHEYGGAPITVGAGMVLSSNFEDQRLHRLEGDTATAITPEPSTPRGHRFADGRITDDGRWLVAIREDHTGGGEARNEVVAIETATGDANVLATGRDFVAAPRLSPDGTRLAWLVWDHPFMPWDAAELWTADFDDGQVSNAVHVRGGVGDAAVSPTWAPDGSLLVSFDGSGFWELHRYLDGKIAQLTHVGADVGFPAWNFGEEHVAPLADGRVVVCVTDRGTDRLELVDTSGTSQAIASPYVSISSLTRFGDGVAFLARRGDGDAAVVLWSGADGFEEIRTVTLPLGQADRASAEHVEVALPSGAVTNAFLYLPASADVVGPEGEHPPLVVFTHGGPTGNVSPVFSASIGYWTTRGFAVADVNYRGSTGHGRAYRDALLGQWGILDVEDTMAVASFLAERGDVDGERMVIRGGSAGGYTTLAVLTQPSHPFAAGTSFFGVADLTMLAEHTHKFESRYLDRIVGPLPQAKAIYDERSPLHHVERLSRPLLVLQGLEDKVVLPEQAEAIVAAAAAQGIPHAYIAFEGEQHGFRKAENIITWLESELSFYGQVLGFTPAGELPTIELLTS